MIRWVKLIGKSILAERFRGWNFLMGCNLQVSGVIEDVVAGLDVARIPHLESGVLGLLSVNAMGCMEDEWWYIFGGGKGAQGDLVQKNPNR